MVANLEQLGAKRRVVGLASVSDRRDEPVLRHVFGITDEERHLGAELHSDDKGGVVRGSEGVSRRAGSDHLDDGRTERSSLAAQRLRTQDAHTACVHRCEQGLRARRLTAARLEAALPDLADLDMGQQRRKPQIVIRMGMREHHHVEAGPPTRGELRCEHPTAHVNGRTDDSASVHEHRPPVG